MSDDKSKPEVVTKTTDDGQTSIQAQGTGPVNIGFGGSRSWVSVMMNVGVAGAGVLFAGYLIKSELDYSREENRASREQQVRMIEELRSGREAHKEESGKLVEEIKSGRDAFGKMIKTEQKSNAAIYGDLTKQLSKSFDAIHQNQKDLMEALKSVKTIANKVGQMP